MKPSVDVSASHLRRPIPIAWQCFIFVASLAVLLMLGMTLVLPVSAEVKRVLAVADFGICMVFMADFLVLLSLHKNRKRYLLTWGWLDFLSSVPTLDLFRWARIARIIRLLRLYRGLRGSSGLLRRLLLKRRETTAFAIILTLVFVAVFSSVAILVAEESSGSRIDAAEDALVWNLSTMTTVGYGDLTPVTTLGRAVAAMTMFAGIGVFGAFTALIASLLVMPSKETEAIEEIESRLCRIEESLDVLKRDTAASLPSEGGASQRVDSSRVE